MIILSASDLTKTYGTEEILRGVSFHINKGERVGLVGANGAGKTTLLNLLAGELEPDGGTVFQAAGTTAGYLKQSETSPPDRTVAQEVMGLFDHLTELEKEIGELSRKIARQSAVGEAVERDLEQLHRMQESYERQNGYGYRSEISGVLKSMAFGEEWLEKPLSRMSGGERTRLALACLLLRKPDLLFLDEPTNHLDIGTLKWLEQYLKSYAGTILLISHDRYFLDQTVSRIFEIENRRLSVYESDYTGFAEEKRRRQEAEQRRYEKERKEILRQEEMIRRFRQHGTEKLAKRARSREKKLEKMQPAARPEAGGARMKLRLKQEFQSGSDVLSAKGLSVSVGSGSRRRLLFEQVGFHIRRGERICITGANGIGKTTLLKLMMERIPPDEGRIRTGRNVTFGYYDQGQQLLNPRNTVLEEMKETCRLCPDGEMRNLLGQFLFRGDDVFLTVDSLSGGEKARLSLLKIMLSGANVLILDEPTNHLDIASREVVEEALLDFEGTVIAVSHDRYFLNRIPTRILELTASGMEEYLGGYDYYMEKKQQTASGKTYLAGLRAEGAEGKNSPADRRDAGENAGTEARDAASARKLKKEEESRRRRREREIASVEEEIQQREEEIRLLEKSICSEEVSSDYQELGRLSRLLEEKRESLGKAYEQWEMLHE